MPTTTKAFRSMRSLVEQDVAVCSVQARGTPRAGKEIACASAGIERFWRPLPHRIVWMIAAALLAGTAAPIIGLALKALGLIHGASLHTWLLDVGSNVDAGGATGAIGAAASGASCSLAQGSDPSDTDGPPSYVSTVSLSSNNGPYSDGPQFKNDPYRADRPVGSPQDNPPVYPKFSGSVGDRIEQAIDMLNAAKAYATGRGDQETEGTAAAPEEAE